MNAKLKDFILTRGLKVIKKIQVLMGRYSLVGDHQFFSPSQFPWCMELEANWRTIREELDEVLTRREDLPNFRDISPDQKHLARENKWKPLFFFAYGLQVPANAARCPSHGKAIASGAWCEDGFLLDPIAAYAHPRVLWPISFGLDHA